MTALQALVETETAGDPQSGQKWVRSSLRQLCSRLQAQGYPVSHQTVARLLESLDYALHVNVKQIEAKANHPQRNQQFEHIASQRQHFQAAGWPVISVDTKKKELIGNFKNAGAVWSRQATAVNVHDFRQEGLGRAVPYGIYDLTQNRGTVYVGQSADTPQFAVDVIARWWESQGRLRYPVADQLLILADGGGSNGYRSRVWKQQLQVQLADGWGLSVSVCHYPTGCSKWNPIEHRLFGPISINWAGKPLLTWETLLAYLRGTRTTTGLEVEAFLHEGVYTTGGTVSDAEMETLNLEHHAICPVWNYTIRPRTHAHLLTSIHDANREVIL